jgi:choline dehydrogenase
MKQNVNTKYHPCGRDYDDASVMDEVRRGNEVDALRVIEASITPRITGGNINAPVMTIAEKISATMQT